MTEEIAVRSLRNDIIWSRWNHNIYHKDQCDIWLDWYCLWAATDTPVIDHPDFMATSPDSSVFVKRYW